MSTIEIDHSYNTAEASKYLLERWAILESESRLKKKRRLGRGPTYCQDIEGGRVYYRESDLDAYARWWLSTYRIDTEESREFSRVIP